MSVSDMVCNLWHIKQTNGLFYYALDYVRSIEEPVTVLVRPALVDATRHALPQHHVQAVTLGRLISWLLHALLNRRWVFTPTPHPFPLHSRQLIVVHDDYPFLGRQGRIKRHLFRIALLSSRCYVGHINHSTALQALPGSIVPHERLWYMPNQGPEETAVQQLKSARASVVPQAGQPLCIALFGSDSRKKRYEDLFLHSVRARCSKSLSFLIYGHPTEYYRELRANFPQLDIQLVPSSQVRMEDFLIDVDVVASVAEHEGFGRPIALALAANIPCFLLASPVFSEFFGNSTRLYKSADELVQALMDRQQGLTMNQEFQELPQIRASFRTAAGRLAALATQGKLAA